jgi:hypothetical protein
MFLVLRLNILIASTHVHTGNPTLGDIRPSVAQLNESAVTVTWTQDAKIPEKYAQYFGYRVDYAVGSFASGGSTLGPTVAHDAAKKNQSLVVSNISAYKQYAFNVVPYREIGDERQYGFGSKAVNIQLTTTGERRTSLSVSPANRLEIQAANQPETFDSLYLLFKSTHSKIMS